MRDRPDLGYEYDREKGEYSLRPLGPEDSDRKAFAWLSKHPTFSRLLPKVAMGFPDAERPASAGSPLDWFHTWRAWLRWTWSATDDLIPTQWDRKLQLANLVFAYALSAGSYKPPRIKRRSPWPKLNVLRIDWGPTPDPFYAVLLRAWAIAHRMRSCANPSCCHPFFLAGRETGKWCSPKCTEWAERVRKREWWRNHGTKWRANQRRKQKPRRHKGGKRR